MFIQRNTWLLNLFRAHHGRTRHFAAYEYFHNTCSILIYQLVQVIKPGRFFREHTHTELVSGSTGLSMKISCILVLTFLPRRQIFNLYFP